MKDAGFVVLGKSNTPEFGITCGHRVGAERRLPQPVGHVAHTPGGSSGGAAAAVAAGVAAARARLRRRRLDPHPGVVLRALRDQAVARARLPRAVRRAARSSCRRAGRSRSTRARRRGVPRRDRGLRAGRRALGAAAGAAVPRRGRRRPGPAAHRVHGRAADPARRSTRASSTSRARAADALAALGHDVVERTPPWVDESLLLGVREALAARRRRSTPCTDDSLLMPLNRALAEAARETSSVVFARAVGALQRAARRIVAFWDDVDVVLTPALAKLPVPIGWVFEPDDPWEQFARGGEFTPFTPIVNVTGPAGGGGAVRRRRRAAGRRAADRPAGGRSDALPARGAAGGGAPVGARRPRSSRSSAESSTASSRGAVADPRRSRGTCRRRRACRRRAGARAGRVPVRSPAPTRSRTGRRRGSARRPRGGRTARAVLSSVSRGSIRRSRFGST